MQWHHMMKKILHVQNVNVVNFNALAEDFGLNIGIIKNIEDLGINNDVLEAYEHSKSVLQQLGHTLKEIDFSELSSGICSYYVIINLKVFFNLSGLMELNMVIDQTKIIFQSCI